MENRKMLKRIIIISSLGLMVCIGTTDVFAGPRAGSRKAKTEKVIVVPKDREVVVIKQVPRHRYHGRYIVVHRPVFISKRHRPRRRRRYAYDYPCDSKISINFSYK